MIPRFLMQLTKVRKTRVGAGRREEGDMFAHVELKVPVAYPPGNMDLKQRPAA